MQGMVARLRFDGWIIMAQSAFEGALAGDDLFAAKAFLRRRAQIAHAPGQFRAELGQSERRAQARRRDDVVTTRVAYARQRVVFRKDAMVGPLSPNSAA